jgi:hypothetical protein
MYLSPSKIQDIVTIAFALEPLSDKKGCTTRFRDLPGKPLEDFIIAGINASKYFRYFAEDLKKDSMTATFKYFPDALENSNHFKSPKTINFGLLEIMFPTVHARLLCDDKTVVVDKILEVLKINDSQDVEAQIEARKTAWKTSHNNSKKEFTGNEFVDSRSAYDFYMKMLDIYSPDNSSYQWATEFKGGLPTLTLALEQLSHPYKHMLEAIADAFHTTQRQKPDLRVGIIADMCAAALFLHLSYMKK